jgi:hypothetical protein
MFSSFPQYLCLAPSFTNVINVYAFCNLHDVSSESSDKAEALPSVSSSKGKNGEAPVVQDMERMQEDLDAVFKETVNRAMTKIEARDVLEKPSMDGQDKSFRARLVVFWMLTNAGLAVAIENINGLDTNLTEGEAKLREKQNTYFAFILLSTFGLSAVRFMGVRGFVFPSFPNLSLHHPVLVLLLQAEPFLMFQEVVNAKLQSPHSIALYHGLILFSFLPLHQSLSPSKVVHKGIYDRCSSLASIPWTLFTSTFWGGCISVLHR